MQSDEPPTLENGQVPESNGAAGIGRNSNWKLRAEERSTHFVGHERDTTPIFSYASLTAKLKHACSLAQWRHRFPISLWLPRYSLQDLKGDLIAGFTVGMTTVPQALAYAQIAELPSEYGLYSSFMACFAYAVFGTSKDVTLGVTAVISLLTAACIPEHVDTYERIRYAILLAFLVGIFQICLGVFRLGFLFSYVSHPVLSGFTTASAFIIMFSQIKNISGIPGGYSTDTVVHQAIHYASNIAKLRGWDVLMGITCVSALLLLRMVKVPKSLPSALREFIRIAIAARYGIVVTLATCVAFALESFGIRKLSLTSDVASALPPFSVPEFSWRNQTFSDHFSDLVSGLPFVAVISAMETIAIAKAFSNKFGYAVDPTQELIAIGMANFLSSFVSAYPVAGSFTKSSLNAQSGVRTQGGNIITGVIVILAMASISAAFKYVPKAALGGVILVAVFMLIDIKIIKELWLNRKSELIPLLGTVISSILLGVDLGFLIGIALSFAMVLYALTKPVLRLETSTRLYSHLNKPGSHRKIVNVRVLSEGPVFFAGAEWFKHHMNHHVFMTHKPKPRGSLASVLRRMSADFIDGLDIPNGKATNAHDRARTEQVVMLPVDPKTAFANETAVFHGTDLDKLDFTCLTSLQSVISKYREANHSVYFVDVSSSALGVVLPKNCRSLIPDQAQNPVSLLVPPLSWADTGASLPMLIQDEEEDELDELRE